MKKNDKKVHYKKKSYILKKIIFYLLIYVISILLVYAIMTIAPFFFERPDSPEFILIGMIIGCYVLSYATVAHELNRLKKFWQFLIAFIPAAAIAFILLKVGESHGDGFNALAGIALNFILLFLMMFEEIDIKKNYTAKKIILYLLAIIACVPLTYAVMIITPRVVIAEAPDYIGYSYIGVITISSYIISYAVVSYEIKSSKWIWKFLIAIIPAVVIAIIRTQAEASCGNLFNALSNMTTSFILLLIMMFRDRVYKRLKIK